MALRFESGRGRWGGGGGLAVGDWGMGVVRGELAVGTVVGG